MSINLTRPNFDLDFSTVNQNPQGLIPLAFKSNPIQSSAGSRSIILVPPTVICKLLLPSHLPAAPPRPSPFLLSSIHHNPPTPNHPPSTSSVLPICDIKAHSHGKLPHQQHAGRNSHGFSRTKTCHTSFPFSCCLENIKSPFFHPLQSLLPTLSIRLFLLVFFYLPHLQTFSLSTFAHDPSLLPFTLGTFLSSTKAFLSSTNLNFQPSLLPTFNFL